MDLRLGAALAEYNEAIRLDPQSAPAFAERGLLQHDREVGRQAVDRVVERFERLVADL